MSALKIVMETAKAALPGGCPLPFSAVVRARFDDSRNRILADVVMFDGKPATMRLTRWAYGWAKGWDSLPGGDCSFENGQWQRVAREARNG